MTSYIIKSILCSGILLIAYHLVLEEERMHRFKRFYLLASIVFSLAVPLINIELKSDSIPDVATYYAHTENLLKDIPQKNAPAKSEIAIADTSINWLEYVPAAIYILVALFLFVRMAHNLRIIYLKKRRSKTMPYKGASLVLLPENTVTFTFLNQIFVGEVDFKQNLIEDEVLTHELAHVNQNHSLDILFTEVIQAFFWINPLLFFYKKAIQLNHEFLADEAVLSEFQNTQTYQLLLLDKILHSRQISLTSSFNYSITKKRLAMMTKLKDRTAQTVKKGAITLLSFCLVIIFCEKIYSQKEEVIDKAKKEKPDTGPIKKPVENSSVIAPGTTKSGDGLSTEQMAEFSETVKKHARYLKTPTGHTDMRLDLTPKQKQRMFYLFRNMTKKEQEATNLNFYESPIPVKSPPTAEIFELWENPKAVGIWLNGKKVDNKELEKYDRIDIAEYSIWKLYGAAKKGRIYKYQLELTTNDHFDKTYQARINDRILVWSKLLFQN